MWPTSSGVVSEQVGVHVARLGLVSDSRLLSVGRPKHQGLAVLPAGFLLEAMPCSGL